MFFEKMSAKGKKVFLNFGIVKNKSHKKNSKNYETFFFLVFLSLPTHFTSNTCFSQIIRQMTTLSSKMQHLARSDALEVSLLQRACGFL